MSTPRLSKSRFQLGLQCHKQLWLKSLEPQLADPISEQTQHIFDTGTAVGALARERFPAGVLVEEDFMHMAEAIEATGRLLTDPPGSIFEAAFDHRGVLVRPDVLVRAGDAWDLYEVKSSTKVKPENISDVAVQLWVLEGAGLPIRRVFLMHLNNRYEYRGGEYDLQQLFTAEDVTEAARGWQTEMPLLVEEMLGVLAGPEPEIPIGKRCDKPYTCAFYAYCHAFLPEHPVTELPRISESVLASLVAEGVFAIGDVPQNYPGLSAAQRLVCSVVRSGEPHFVHGIDRALSGLEHPIHFLDFETVQSALPLYPGTRPWQQVPFQWSDHVMSPSGELEHSGFLFDGSGDPRPCFVESLLGQVGESGSVVVYTSFENTQLNSLAEAFPAYEQRIGALQKRLFDLEKVVRTHVHHPDCCGSTSIKRVLPALADDVSYEGLGIQDGSAASRLYLAGATGRLDPAEREAVYADLRKYCAVDTLAMVRVLQVLSEQCSAQT